MILPAQAVVATAIILATAAVHGRGDACRRATVEYDIAKAEVATALRAYQKCLSSNLVHGACASEFTELDFEQDRFEAAAAEYARACR